MALLRYLIQIKMNSMDIAIICLLVLFVIVCLASGILTFWITADKVDLQWMKKDDSLQWLYNFITNMRDDENVDNN